MNKPLTTYHIRVKGLVQGVGFRPFIYRLAHYHHLNGWVENRNDGVQIKITASEQQLQQFIRGIREQAPLAANVHSVDYTTTGTEHFTAFTIVKSTNVSQEVTEISPDIAVCDACLQDMKTQAHRIDYPFINCTNCGPRFSIIRHLPYDRDKTTMQPFPLCEQCESEYHNVHDRRFHAQPVACTKCGPHYELFAENTRIHGTVPVVNKVAQLVQDGKTVAMKGVGGFHLACDATNEQAVSNLRASKHREGKPFAVMMKSVEVAEKYLQVTAEAKAELLSWRRPIVLLKQKQVCAEYIAPSVNVGFDTLGVLLPYMPLHYLLFEHSDLEVIVLTSGNFSDEPIVIDNAIAEQQLSNAAQGILHYNRDIYNRTDDSVVKVINRQPRLLRRSRGYAPNPVHLPLNAEGILATGAELVNCFAIGKGKQAIISQHIGDLKNYETYEFYTETIEQFKQLFRLQPSVIACDMHPDYLSTKYALERKNVDIEQVQHHHAHIASCMAEHGLDEKVIGVAMDGTGYGDDGHIWGGELLVCDLKNYQRKLHFDYQPMPGGDLVTKQPWRMAMAYLYDAYGSEYLNLPLPFLQKLDKKKQQMVHWAIEKAINTPLSSSCGRIFDAVSALTGLCTESRFHAEAPMRLEAAAIANSTESYEFRIDNDGAISFRKMIKQIVNEMIEGVSQTIIATKFHNTIINAIFTAVEQVARQTQLTKVVLSGGSFQNAILSEQLEQRLTRSGYQVFSQYKLPANDGGIAVGQLLIAAKRRQ